MLKSSKQISMISPHVLINLHNLPLNFFKDFAINNFFQWPLRNLTIDCHLADSLVIINCASKLCAIAVPSDIFDLQYATTLSSVNLEHIRCVLEKKHNIIRDILIKVKWISTHIGLAWHASVHGPGSKLLTYTCDAWVKVQNMRLWSSIAALTSALHSCRRGLELWPEKSSIKVCNTVSIWMVAATHQIQYLQPHMCMQSHIKFRGIIWFMPQKYTKYNIAWKWQLTWVTVLFKSKFKKKYQS